MLLHAAAVSPILTLFVQQPALAAQHLMVDPCQAGRRGKRCCLQQPGWLAGLVLESLYLFASM